MQDLIAKVWRRRTVFLRTVLADVRAMHSGTAFGLAWILLGPLLLLSLYATIYA